MKNKDIDNFIREKAKEDQKISKKAEDVIKKFEKNVVLEGSEQMEKRVVTISFGNCSSTKGCARRTCSSPQASAQASSPRWAKVKPSPRQCLPRFAKLSTAILGISWNLSMTRINA